MLWESSFSMTLFLSMCSLVAGRDALCCFTASPGNLALFQGSLRPTVGVHKPNVPTLGGALPMAAKNTRSTAFGALSSPRSSQDYILDTFDPEDEEDELSNEAMLK